MKDEYDEEVDENMVDDDDSDDEAENLQVGENDENTEFLAHGEELDLPDDTDEDLSESAADEDEEYK